MPPPPQDVTQLLQAWRHGQDAALAELLPIVHQELRRLARRHMYGERPGRTLQATALVNEAYLRLVNSRQVNWQNRAHFFAISAQLMRRILVDAATISVTRLAHGLRKARKHNELADERFCLREFCEMRQKFVMSTSL